MSTEPITAEEKLANALVCFDQLQTTAGRLHAEIDRRARNEARLMNALDAVEALTKDTDGGDIDGDADIPIGEIRRVLAEHRAHPAAQNEAVDTVGSLRATLAAAESDGWRGWVCCEHHENRANGLPCDGACCSDCPSLAAQNDTEVP